MENIQIIPAILPKNFAELEEKLALLKAAYLSLNLSEKMMVQIDVCNDKLFENFDFSIIENYIDIFDFEFDLMNINLDKIKERLDELDDSNFSRIIFHYEDWKDKLLGFDFKNFSKEIGLAIIPKTQITEIEPYLSKVQFIQFMGIDEVGYQGSTFNPAVIEKIKNFKESNPKMIISIDGGVSFENAEDLINAGINRLATGSAIFGKNNSILQIIENIKKFRNI